MANDFAALGSAIYTMIDNATTVPVFNTLAPQGSAWPYVVFQRQDARDEFTFRGRGVLADYVIKVVGRVADNNPSPAPIERIYDRIHGSIVAGSAMAVSGYTLLRMQRQATIEYRDPEMLWHVGGLYQVEIWEA